MSGGRHERLPYASTLMLLTVLIPCAVCARAGARASYPRRQDDRRAEEGHQRIKALRGVDLTGPPWSILLRIPNRVNPGAANQAALLEQERAGTSPHGVRNPLRRAALDQQLGVERPRPCGGDRRGEAGGHRGARRGRRPDRMSDDEAIISTASPPSLQSKPSVSSWQFFFFFFFFLSLYFLPYVLLG